MTVILSCLFFTLTVSHAHAQDTTTGLVAHWKLDDLGTDAIDYVSVNNGTMQGGLDGATDSVPGRLGTALNFDGSADYIAVPSAASIDDIFATGGTKLYGPRQMQSLHLICDVYKIWLVRAIFRA